MTEQERNILLEVVDELEKEGYSYHYPNEILRMLYDLLQIGPDWEEGT